MPSTFAINYTPTTSVITIAGVDQTVESQLAANQTAPTADEAGNPIAPPADPSMHSDSPVTICTLYFKVIDTAPTGDARFWLGNLGGFTDNTGAQVTATAGNTAAVPVTSLLSSDASLGSLSIDNIEIYSRLSPTHIHLYSECRQKRVESCRQSVRRPMQSHRQQFTGSATIFLSALKHDLRESHRRGRKKQPTSM
jgi:hypothetical protein